MTAITALAMLNLDCADPAAMAAFYHGMLGWEITASERDYAVIRGGTTTIGFTRRAGYQAPQWPEPAAPMRYHFDMYTDDVAEATAKCLALGGGKPGFQPGGDRWQVLTDPSGHPFCVCPRQPG
ncbi:MAG TPA: VOC family protein [Streptosporangiaceae bacterium]|jgi:predicted enzyme related to lactoylglutathione lyase